jgi:hypothetical protein
MAAAAKQLRELGEKLAAELPPSDDALAKLLEVSPAGLRTLPLLKLPASPPLRRAGLAWICGRGAQFGRFLGFRARWSHSSGLACGSLAGFGRSAFC